MKIELTVKPSSADLLTLSQGIQAFNGGYLADEVVFESDHRFAVLARNKAQQVIGGIRANAFWDYCIIELLWIAEAARGQGLGRALLAEAEAYAKQQGYHAMRVETLSFQAKPFYEKCGFRVYGQLDDHPLGHTSYCLVKSL